jgi:hypothetical protein
LTLDEENWGDRLAMFNFAWLTFFDRRSHRFAEQASKFSPLLSKLVNDGAYARAIFGSLSLITPVLATVLAVVSVSANDGAILTPPWQLLLAIAVLGMFDAFAGFASAIVFAIATVVAAGHLPNIAETRLLMGIIVVAIGPALLSTAFRSIRKAAALNLNSWWERITDLAVVPFMAGWSASAMISTLPALAGLTLNVANHVNDFALAIAAAAFVRVLVEEFAARYYPARLNSINPDEIADPPMIQKVIALSIKFAIWVFISTALMGPSWQIWVGSALFLLPSILTWFADRLPNSPTLWRFLPTGIPGLALSLVVATLTTSLVGAWLGATPELAQWSFVILPLPLLAISILGLFGRHGGEQFDDRPVKQSVWVYRIGGVIMLLVTLKLAGVI